MKRRLLIELTIFTVLWTVFVFFLLFPEGKQYLQNKNPSFMDIDSQKVTTVKQEIKNLKRQKEFLRKKLFPIEETIAKQKSLQKILKNIKDNARKKQIKTLSLELHDGEKIELEKQKVKNILVEINLECNYKNFMRYLDILFDSPLFIDINYLRIKQISEYDPNLKIELKFNTLCYE